MRVPCMGCAQKHSHWHCVDSRPLFAPKEKSKRGTEQTQPNSREMYSRTNLDSAHSATGFKISHGSSRPQSLTHSKLGTLETSHRGKVSQSVCPKIVNGCPIRIEQNGACTLQVPRHSCPPVSGSPPSDGSHCSQGGSRGGGGLSDKPLR